MPSLSSASLIPSSLTLDNFREILTNPTINGEQTNVHYPNWYLNSMIVAFASALFTVMLGALAAYAFSRFRFKGRRMGMLTLLLIQMFPQFLAVVAIYLILLRTGEIFPVIGLNSLTGLVLVYLGGALGVNAWLMKGFFDSIPNELDESARVDGATPAQVFWGIILPLGAPVLAVVGLLSFISTMNEYLIAGRLMQSTTKFTLPVGMYGFIADQYGQRWGPVLRRRRARGDPGRRPLHVPAAVHRPRPHLRLRQGMSGATPLSEPHHDGSPLYVPEQPSEIGDEVTVRLRVPRSVTVDVAAVRYVRDGEPRGVAATIDEESETDVWYRATVPVWNPTVPYRWVLGGGDVGYAWVNGAGTYHHDVPDDRDFMLSLAPAGPDWHAEGVVYEIFPDRFATTGAFSRNGDRPDWAVPRDWDALPTGRGPETPFELFGGDLPGDRAAPRPRRAPRRHRDLPDPVLPGRQHAPLRRELVRPRRPAARRRRGARLALARRPRARPAPDRRPHAQPLRLRPRVVRRRTARAPTLRSATSSTSTTACRAATRRGWACARSPSSTGARPSSGAA